jgi:hypothetical protein
MTNDQDRDCRRSRPVRTSRVRLASRSGPGEGSWGRLVTWQVAPDDLDLGPSAVAVALNGPPSVATGRSTCHRIGDSFLRSRPAPRCSLSVSSWCLATAHCADLRLATSLGGFSARAFSSDLASSGPAEAVGHRLIGTEPTDLPDQMRTGQTSCQVRWPLARSARNSHSLAVARPARQSKW